MIIDLTTLKNPIKVLVPLAIAMTLVACSDSTSVTPEVQADPAQDANPDLNPPAIPGTGTGTGTGTDTDTDTDTDTTQNDTELEAASRIDIPRYGQLIENVRNVLNAAEFNGDNYAAAVAAVAETSEAQVVYSHVAFLALLESQVIADESPLTLQDTVNSDTLLNGSSSVNRTHTCPDGGSLLATKAESSDTVDLAGRYSFDECKIGGILIDGGYTVRLRPTDNAFTTDINLGIRIDGVDGVSTSLSGSVIKNETLAVDASGVNNSTSESSVAMTTTVTVPSDVVLTMEVSTLNTLTSDADSLPTPDLLPEDEYTVSLGNARVWVSDNNSARLSGTTTAGGSPLTKTAGATTFEQGNVNFYLLPDSNTMTIQADNGDPTNFDTLVTLTDGSVVSFFTPWDSGDYAFGPAGSVLGFSLPAEAQ